MGSVYKAVDLNLNREVALKILKKECSANAEERAKLEEEARIIASINHPHVVKVFSFGEDQGQFYLAMELAEKGSLDDLMSLQQRLSEAQVLRVGIQIAEGLDAALEHNLIHRDIKPGNILFADPQTAKLVDFGLAAVINEIAHARGEIWGTPYYIAPEKLDNQPEDFRSDIYSLGGTLFHALAGRPPYEAETASTVALKQLMSQPVSLQTFAPDVSSETAYVINRMLTKDPAERYDQKAELIEHLVRPKQTARA
jgi:serine/threonine protein kinase